MFGAFYQHVQHFISNVFDFVTLHLMNEPFEHLFFILQIA